MSYSTSESLGAIIPSSVADPLNPVTPAGVSCLELLLQSLHSLARHFTHLYSPRGRTPLKAEAITAAGVWLVPSSTIDTHTGADVNAANAKVDASGAVAPALGAGRGVGYDGEGLGERIQVMLRAYCPWAHIASSLSAFSRDACLLTVSISSQ